MSEWISVKDKLPEFDGRYLVVVNYTFEPYVKTAWFARNLRNTLAHDCKNDCYFDSSDFEVAGWYNYDYDFCYLEPSITYWQPMPNPPEKTTKGESALNESH